MAFKNDYCIDGGFERTAAVELHQGKKRQRGQKICRSKICSRRDFNLVARQTGCGAGSAFHPTKKSWIILQLTNHLETFINLGAGMSCTILPTVLNRSNLQLTMSLELKGPDGSVKDLSVVRVTTKTDKPFEVAVGDMDLTLTPRISSE